MIDLEKRAWFPKQKKTVLDRLLVAWLDNPELRLGQLLQNSLLTLPSAPDESFIFNVEDSVLIEAVESFSLSLKKHNEKE